MPNSPDAPKPTGLSTAEKTVISATAWLYVDTDSATMYSQNTDTYSATIGAWLNNRSSMH
jgi:hypothetical protein